MAGNIGCSILFGLLGVGLFAWGSRATVKNLPGMTTLGQVAVTSFGMAGLSIALYFICTIFMLSLIHISEPTRRS